MSMRDSQRSAVYKWERAVVRSHVEAQPAGAKPRYDLLATMELQDCEALVAEVFRDYRAIQSLPVVRDGRGARYARGSLYLISLPRWARTRPIVLHEIAHALEPAGPSHGPCFARLLLDLLCRYAGVDKAKARALGVHQRPRRVRFASPAEAPRPMTRHAQRLGRELSAANTLLQQAQSAYREALKAFRAAR